MRHALHAEFTKLRTTPGTAALLLTTLAVTVGIGAIAGAGSGCASAPCELDPVDHGLTGVLLGQALVAVFAIGTVGGEYGTGMVHATLTAVPRRLTAAAAKAATVLGAVLAVAAIAVPVSLLAAAPGLAGHGHSIEVSDADTIRALLGSIGYLVLIGALSLGIAWTVRDATAAIGTTLGLLYLFPMLAAVVNNEPLARALYRISPMSAGLSVQATTGLDELVIAPLAGLGVLAAWAVAALLAGGLSLRLRDA